MTTETAPYFQRNRATLYLGDVMDVLPTLEPDSIDAVVTDPPYHLTTGKKGGSGPASASLKTPQGRARITTGFMGKVWDGGDIAHNPDVWREAFRVAKPGAHLLAFGGTRTFHRLACAIEDAGWEIRDCIMWVYGSGFPKSLDVSKAIDKAAGVEREVIGYTKNARPNRIGKLTKLSGPQTIGGEITNPQTDAARQWEGWGTALKPAWEPIIVARKPLVGTVAANVLEHGTGAINVDGCRVEAQGRPLREVHAMRDDVEYAGNALAGRVDGSLQSSKAVGVTDLGRFPSNLIHDGSEEVLALFPAARSSGVFSPVDHHHGGYVQGVTDFGGKGTPATMYADSGSAARFFYTAKASASERGKCDHPTVKPLSLMRYLCRLVTPPGGLVLDPFAGSGTTGRAAALEGFRSILVEQDEHNCQVAAARFPQEVLDL